MSKSWREMTQRERDGRRGHAWERKRAAVFAQHGDVCWLCGRPGADTVDHVLPLAMGGTNELANLRPAHGKKRAYCPGNYGRKSSPVEPPRRSRAW